MSTRRLHWVCPTEPPSTAGAVAWCWLRWRSGACCCRAPRPGTCCTRRATLLSLSCAWLPYGCCSAVGLEAALPAHAMTLLFQLPDQCCPPSPQMASLLGPLPEGLVDASPLGQQLDLFALCRPAAGGSGRAAAAAAAGRALPPELAQRAAAAAAAASASRQQASAPMSVQSSGLCKGQTEIMQPFSAAVCTAHSPTAQVARRCYLFANVLAGAAAAPRGHQPTVC